VLILGTNLLVVNETKKLLSSLFEMKDMGEVDVVLGIKIQKTNTGFSLSQSHYIEKMSKKFDQFDVTPVRTPYDPTIQLRKNKRPSASQTEYAKIIGSVMFLMNFTHPDIAYGISRLSHYTHNPSQEHCNALLCLLKYLKDTIDWCLHFNKFLAVLGIL